MRGNDMKCQISQTLRYTIASGFINCTNFFICEICAICGRMFREQLKKEIV
jgi:hypothetical protein